MKNTLIILAALLSTGLQAGDYGKSPIKNPVSYGSDSPWRFSAEALYLKAHSNEDIYDPQDEEFGYRFGLSYQGSGLGIRASYFHWEGTESVNLNSNFPEVQVFGLEGFDQFELGAWKGEYSFGVRHASFKEHDLPTIDTDFSGTGPTIGVDLSRELFGPFSLYAGARATMLFGEDDVNYDDSFGQVMEIFGGVQYAIGECGSLIRLGVESQNWQSLSDNDNEDTALFGGVVKAQLAF
jgi:hypothetical protein